MNGLASIAASCLLLGALTLPQASSIDEFRRIEQQLADAYLKGDRTFVDGLLADDWTSIDYQGRPWTKSAVLAMFDPGGPAFTRMEIGVENVRLLGDVAVVTGRSMAAGRVQGRELEIVQRYTDVFAKRDGRWRVVASQGTQVP
jgi:uncharacterized protein (TIGR02246 family)